MYLYFFLILLFKQSLIISYGRISCFDLEQILTAKNNATFAALYKSEGNYYNIYENDFLVLPDEKTLVGRKNDLKTLQTEDITNNAEPIEIFKINQNYNQSYNQRNNQDYIRTLLFNEITNCLLVGLKHGRAIQFERNSTGSWKTLKDYGNLGIGAIISCDYFGNLAVMGGNSLRFIDMQKREIICKSLKTAIKNIRSLQFCKISKTKTFLVVSGESPNYLNETDLFDASKLFDTQKAVASSKKKMENSSEEASLKLEF